MPIIFAHKVIYCRESFRLKRTMQWSITVKPHPLPRGLPKSMRGWSRAFTHTLYKNTSLLHTLTMGRIFCTRYSFIIPCFQCYEYYFNLCIFFNSFKFFRRSQIDRYVNEFASTDMTIVKLQKHFTRPVKTYFKAKWFHWWNAPIVRGWRTSSPSTSLWWGRLWMTGFTRHLFGLKYIHPFAFFI